MFDDVGLEGSQDSTRPSLVLDQTKLQTREVAEEDVLLPPFRVEGWSLCRAKEKPSQFLSKNSTFVRIVLGGSSKVISTPLIVDQS